MINNRYRYILIIDNRYRYIAYSILIAYRLLQILITIGIWYIFALGILSL